MKRFTYTLDDSIVLLKWVCGILTVFALFFGLSLMVDTRQAQDRNYKLGLENNTYHRTIACILSVPLADRTNDYISNCYLRAEAHNNITVDHFGNK